jgi:hypothetical protein
MMPTYLLTWNPQKGSDVYEEIRRFKKKGKHRFEWSCENRKTIPAHFRVFISKQGRGAVGVFASGYAVSPVRPGSRWQQDGNPSKGESNYADVEWERMSDPDKDDILDSAFLLKNLAEVCLGYTIQWDRKSNLPQATTRRICGQD